MHDLRPSMIILVAVLFSHLLIPRYANAQDTSAQDAKEHETEVKISGPLQTIFRKESEKLKFRLADDKSTQLQLSKPVMSWSSFGGWSGDIFTWKGKGRVQVIGCIGAHELEDGRYLIFHEFHSLADESIQESKFGESQTWKPSAQLKFEVIEDAPAPAKTKPLRLTQMRGLARSFKIGMQVDGQNTENEMRLLPQPVARESSDDGPVIDSAVFTFVSSSGTDPEAFLVLEARRVEKQLRWTYAVARFTTREIWHSFGDDGEVTRIKPTRNNSTQPQITEPYFFRNAVVISQEELDSAND